MLPTANREFYHPTDVGTTWADGDGFDCVVTAVETKGESKIVTYNILDANGEVERTCRRRVTVENVFDIDDEEETRLYQFRFTAKKGDVFRIDSCFPGNVPVKITCEVREKEEIKVPAGTFVALPVRETIVINCPGDQVVIRAQTTWYASGVGPIRTVSEKGVEYELKRFKQARTK